MSGTRSTRGNFIYQAPGEVVQESEIPHNRQERRAKDKKKNYWKGHYERIRNNDTNYHK